MNATKHSQDWILHHAVIFWREKRLWEMNTIRIKLLHLLHWGKSFLGKLTGSQLVKKFPAFYGTRKFITAFTCARHLSLSSTSSIQSMLSHPTSWRSILLLSSHLCLGLPSGLFPSDLLTKPCTHFYSPSYVLHAPPISLFTIWSPEQYWVRSTDL